MRKLYSIFDNKAGAWSPPMAMSSHGEALRSFQDATKDQQTMIAKHPEDFKLVYIGQFDDQSGSLIPEPKAVYLATGSEFTAPGPLVAAAQRVDTAKADRANLKTMRNGS